MTHTFNDDLTDVALSLLAQLRQAGNEAFGSLGLTYGQAMLLISVEQGFTRPKELMARLGMVFPAFSSLVKTLAEAGLITRALDPTDRRRVEVHLAPDGKEMCRRIRQAWLEVRPLDLSELSEAQVSTFLEVARTVTNTKPPKSSQ